MFEEVNLYSRGKPLRELTMTLGEANLPRPGSPILSLSVWHPLCLTMSCCCCCCCCSCSCSCCILVQLVAIPKRVYDVTDTALEVPITPEIVNRATAHFPKPASSSQGGKKSGDHRKFTQQRLKALVNTLAHIGASMLQPGEEEKTPTNEAPMEVVVVEGEKPVAEEGPLEVDPESLQTLVNMGFPEEASRKALLLNRFLWLPYLLC